MMDKYSLRAIGVYPGYCVRWANCMIAFQLSGFTAMIGVFVSWVILNTSRLVVEHTIRKAKVEEV